MPINTNSRKCENNQSFWDQEDDMTTQMQLPDDDEEKIQLVRRRKEELLRDIEQIKDDINGIIDQLRIIQHAETDGNVQDQDQQNVNALRSRFNTDAKKGIEALIEQKVINDTPEEIAQYLLRTGGLSKTQIGKYLGEADEKHQQVLKCFVEEQNFRGMNILQALRQFLWSFRIPGESQIIERIMELFAAHYNICNISELTNDAVFMLCYSFMMLNTTFHNPNVKNKMSFLDYRKSVCDLMEKESSLALIMEQLPHYYETLKREPFHLNSDETDDTNMTFFEPDKEGWIFKQGSGRRGNIKTWKRRWFVLANHCLYYFQFAADKEPKGIIPLESDLRVRETDPAYTTKHRSACFEIYSESNSVIKACKTGGDGKVREGKHEIYRMCAPNDQERKEWIESINNAIRRDRTHLPGGPEIGDKTA